MADKTTHKVQRLRKLPWQVVWAMSIKSIRVRLGRALAASCGVMLAIIFFAWLLVDKAIVQALIYAGNEELLAKVKLTLGEENKVQHYWLIGLSFMVCGVGIMNAMLMSVMERYREIGTMKCLGALDWFIMKLFLVEEILQGGIASLLGSIIGSILAILVELVRFGGVVLRVMPWDKLGLTIIASLGIGVSLTAIFSLYPAWVAAKMPPAEAMRVEV